MINTTKLIATALLASIIALSLVAVTNVKTSAQEAMTETKTTEQQEESATEKPATYAYIAQPGDSYTKIVRKAIQTYGINKQVNLTEAGIIFAETTLTQTAGSPMLSIGQKVELKENDLVSASEKANNLTEAQQKAWSVYAKFVDFNTNNVGEVRN